MRLMRTVAGVVVLMLAAQARGEPSDAPAAAGCPLEDAHVHAKLNGAIDAEIDWSSADMECEGMPRVDGGFRLRFTGPSPAGSLVIVLGVPDIAEGASAKAAPVNVTLIPEGHSVYGTRGADKCVLDEVTQSALPSPTEDRRWRVSARGFCLGPARAVGGADAILVTTFEVTGLLTWTPEIPNPP